MAKIRRIINLRNYNKQQIQRILQKYKNTGIIIAIRVTASSNGKIFFNPITLQYSSDSDLRATAYFSGAIREIAMTRLIYIQEAGECKKFTSVNFRNIITKNYIYKWCYNFRILDPTDLPFQ